MDPFFRIFPVISRAKYLGSQSDRCTTSQQNMILIDKDLSLYGLSMFMFGWIKLHYSLSFRKFLWVSQ